MSFKIIGDMLKVAMDEVKNTDAIVGSVFNYDIKIESGISLPAIIITPIDGDEVYLDSCSNDVGYRFAIRVIDDIQTNIENIESNMRVISDAIITKLKAIPTIVRPGGKTYRLEYTYNRGYIETQAPMRVFEIICSFRAIDKI